MNARLTLICNELMHIITTFTAKSDKPNTVMFGIDSFAVRLSPRATADECKIAINHMIDKGYIKKRGAYTIGLGNGEGLTPYPAFNHDLWVLAENNDPTITEQDIEAPKQDVKPESDVYNSSPLNKLVEFRAYEYAATEPTSATPEPDSDEFQPVQQSINALKARLSHKPVEQLNKKLRTLDELGRLLDPTIASVLNDIRNDLLERSK